MHRATVVLFLAVFVLDSIPGTKANRCIGRPDGTFVNDFTECEAFFTCIRQTQVPGRCPDGFYFNEERQLCDNPWNVVCLLCIGGEPGEPEEPEEPGEPEEPEDVDPANVPVLDFFPIENECRKYTLCADGVGFLRECAEGLKFNPVSRTCDLEANVDCVESICPNNVNPMEATMVPDPTDCSRYYICFQRQPIGGTSHSCNEGLLFDPVNMRCDFEENVECVVVPQPPNLTECPPSGLHYIPETGSCESYFICLNGDKIGPLQCADGLIFDINTQTCRPRADEGSQCITDPPVTPAIFLGYY